MSKTAVKGATLKTAIANITGISNADFWDKCRRFSPSFASHTAEGTAVEFNEKGFEAIKLADMQALNEFFEISMRIAFQMLNVAKAKNPLAGLVQVYDTPNGGFVQRMSVQSIKPITPGFLNVENGEGLSPFLVRKPVIEERFYQMNFDFQSVISIQEYQMKTLFISEYGMGETLAGILQGLANGYTIQEYVNIKAALNQALNSDQFPLQDTQKIEITGYDGSDASLIKLILAIKNLATRMETAPTTSAFNAMKFDSACEVSDHVLLLRAGIKNEIDVKTLVGAFNPDKLSLPFEVKEVEDFGGLVAKDSEDNTLTTVYDELGSEVGFVNGTPDGKAYKKADGKWYVKVSTVETEVIEVPDHYEDPNKDVLGVVMQKGAIFENAQNPYSVTPIYNPRNMVTSYWANRPKNGVNVDALYNLVAFTKPAA